MLISTPKQLYFKNNDFKLEYQVYLDSVFIHTEVINWNPRSAREGYIVFAKMQKEFKNEGCSRFISISPNPEFCKMYGGYSLQKINYENKEYEVMVWDLKS